MLHGHCLTLTPILASGMLKCRRLQTLMSLSFSTYSLLSGITSNLYPSFLPLKVWGVTQWLCICLAYDKLWVQYPATKQKNQLRYLLGSLAQLLETRSDIPPSTSLDTLLY